MNICSFERYFLRNRKYCFYVSENPCRSRVNYMSDLELGDQPLIQMMEKWGLDNEDLVNASTEQLTFKQVQRARTGRRLTLKMMQKVLRAYNVAIWYKLNKKQKDKYVEMLQQGPLFNYAKGYDENWVDPNDALIAEINGKDE